jgi:small conductance mechanosensitive channel
VGLFSAAFGLGARPVISDILVGISFLFEDTFAVGEKVEILGMEGVIESINLRTTWMRSPTGELYTIPNGEIRTVRNFSRGRFSVTSVTFSIPAEALENTLEILTSLGQEAMLRLPNLLEPWQVLSESGTLGPHTELTILAKARFGKAAEMRPRLLALIHENLNEAGIHLTQ